MRMLYLWMWSGGLWSYSPLCCVFQELLSSALANGLRMCICQSNKRAEGHHIIADCNVNNNNNNNFMNGAYKRVGESHSLDWSCGAWELDLNLSRGRFFDWTVRELYWVGDFRNTYKWLRWSPFELDQRMWYSEIVALGAISGVFRVTDTGSYFRLEAADLFSVINCGLKKNGYKKKKKTKNCRQRFSFINPSTNSVTVPAADHSLTHIIIPYAGRALTHSLTRTSDYFPLLFRGGIWYKK